MSDYFTELGKELFAAAERQQAAPSSEHTKRRRGIPRRAVAIGAGAVLLAGVPAAAVTGVFRPYREPDGLVRLTQRQVVASGVTQDGRKWELLSSYSGVGFCVGLRVTQAGFGTSTSEGCGGKEPETLSLATSSGGNQPGTQNALAFGTAPAAAVRVRALARGRSVAVDTFKAPEGQTGRFYFAEFPFDRSLGPTTVIALDADDREIARTQL